MKNTILFIAIYLFLSSVIYAVPTRENGLSVHIAPERSPEIFKVEKRGFIVSHGKTPRTPTERPIFSTPQQLVEYFLEQSQEIQDNGLWVITTNPKAYNDSELNSVDTLIKLCLNKKIPVSFCRGRKLPDGWIKGSMYSLKNSDLLYQNKDKAIKLANEAISNAKEGNLDNAIRLYTECLEITFEPAYMYHGRGKVYGLKGDFPRSISDISKALELNPSPQSFAAQCYNDRAIAYLQSGDPEKSWKDTEKAISMGFRMHPGFLAALKSRGFPKK